MGNFMLIAILVLLGFILGLLLGYFYAYYGYKKNINHELSKQEEGYLKIKKELENSFKSIAMDVTQSNSTEFLKLANEKFSDLSKKSESTLNQKKELIDHSLNEMSKKLESINKQSNELNSSLNQNREETSKLRDTTVRLNKVLSSSQKRGQWGERMVEDILQILGFVENVNYKKQVVIKSGERPDFTFLLPKQKKINMDVKFPLEHYENYINANDKVVISSERKDFLSDVKNHIKSISNKEYIDISDGTLDYVLMFIPNESIYSFINKEDQSIIDFALNNKVLLCSPMTLYAILGLINQATRNFVIEQKASEVMSLMNKFKVQWQKYSELLLKFGRSINTVQNDYDNLVGTRKTALERPLKDIEEISENMNQKEIS